MDPSQQTDQLHASNADQALQQPVPTVDSGSSLPPLGQGQAMPAPVDSADPVASALPPDPQLTPSPAGQVAPTQKLSPHAPDIAEDVDLIEKEWVLKAKEIIKTTSNDPNLQTKEMNRFKADYLKTRYNKDLKVSD